MHQPVLGRQVADVTGAWAAATSILAALRRRDESGEGTWIDQSLFEASMYQFVFLWSPALDAALPRAGSEPLAFGLIFATFMVAMMIQ